MKLTNTLRDAFVNAAMLDVPQIDYREQARAAATKHAASLMPPKVQAIYKDPATRDFVATHYQSFGTSFSANLPGPRAIDAEKTRAAVADILTALKTQELALADLRAKLRRVAYGVSTRKALAEALPEFEKYLPADEAAVNRSLPVVANVVADFVKAGWPKGKKPVKAAV